MAPEARSKFGAPCSNLRFFGTKCTVLKKLLVTLLGLFGALAVIRRPHSDTVPGELCPPCPTSLRPCTVPRIRRKLPLRHWLLYFDNDVCSQHCITAESTRVSSWEAAGSTVCILLTIWHCLHPLKALSACT